MNLKEENKTKKWIIDALFDLLRRKDYQDITISQIVNKAGLGRRTFYRYFKTKNEVIEYTTKLLMNEFANTIIINHAETQESIAKSYFEFWENHVDILMLMNKAHLLYFIEDHLLSLIYEVAKKVGHVPDHLDEEGLAEYYKRYKFAFAVKLAGFWKATVLWSEEEPRRSPEEMSRLINDILK
ncbi:TetR/AcrR family transcriptional regulator [Robinsoniella peoriensis]|uniref:TetR/AcrR family transcriptional regulator n=1 Tax=Robinsoniella peoriensis TaxID=180332 RepID=UPI00085CCEC5|nr:TetR/AcrR family transcriptional regulator [Robinsoniella peoriensis]